MPWHCVTKWPLNLTHTINSSASMSQQFLKLTKQIHEQHVDYPKTLIHYNDVIMDSMTSQITSLTIVYSVVYSGEDQRRHQSSASLVFVREMHRSLPRKMASNAENFSIWWRHHIDPCRRYCCLVLIINRSGTLLAAVVDGNDRPAIAKMEWKCQEWWPIVLELAAMEKWLYRWVSARNT